MTQYVINIGALPNDGTGDPLRTAFNLTNLNFDQVFAAGPVLSNIRIANNTILTTNTNGNLVLAPNGIGVVQANVNIVPNAANIRNLGAADRRWSTVYVQYANVSGGLTVADLTATGNVTVGGNLSVTGNIINVANIITDAKTIQLANTAGTANAANGSGITVGANDNIATFLFNSANTVWATNIGVAVGGPITGTSLAVSDATIYGNTTGINALFTGTITTPNIVVNNISSDDSTFVTIQDGLDVKGDITAETVSVTGNVTGNYFIGNGSQLTGVSNYANANAVAYGQAGWAGNIVPAASNTYSLGNSTLWWSNVWVAGNTIYIGGVPLGMSAGNVLTVNGNAVLQNNSNSTISTTGNITAGYFFGNGSQLTGLNTSSISNGTSNVNIATANGPVTVSYAGSGNTWTFGNVDVPEALYWPDGSFQATAFVGIAQDLSNPGNATITSNSTGNTTYAWTFDDTGNMTFPSNGQIVMDGGDGTIGNQSDDFVISWDNEEIRVVSVGGSIEMQADAAFRVQTNYDGANVLYASRWEFSNNELVNISNNFGIVSEAGNLTLSGGRDGVNSGNTIISAVDLGNAVVNWTFGNNGVLSLPNGGEIDNDGNNIELRSSNNINFEATSDLNIYTDDGNSQWTFGSGNTLTLPGGTAVIDSSDDNIELRSNNNINIETFNDVNIYTGNGAYQFYFSYNGGFVLPANGAIVGETANNNGYINWVGNSSGDGNGFTTMQLVPDGTVETQSLVLDPTAPGHIHLRAPGLAGNIEQPNANIFLGPENTNFEITAQYANEAEARIHSAGNTWTFANNGNLVLPSDANIVGTTPNNAGHLQWLGNSAGDGSGSTTLRLIPDDTLEGNEQYIIIDPTGGGDIHIRPGGNIDNSNGRLILGGENSAFVVESGSNPTLKIFSDENEWTFYGNAELAAPGDISAVGNITGNFFVGDGSQLTNVNAVTVDVTDTNGLTTIYYPTFVENRANAQIARADVDLTYRTDENLLTVGNVSVTGNVTAANFFGNVANLTNSGNTFSMSPTGVLSLGDAGQTYLTMDAFGITANTQMVLSAANASSGNNSSILFDKNGGGLSIRLETNVGPSQAFWSFYAGNITFPDGSNQTTAYGNANATSLLAAFGNNSISTTGNITAGNLIGNISITGNVTGTSANVTLVAGSYLWTFDNTGTLTLPAVGGNEGAELQLTQAANSTLAGNTVSIDQYIDQIRFFEGGGNTRGAYIDLTQAAAGVGTLLNNRVSAFVDAGTFVTMDNIQVTVTSSSNRGLSLATTTGSITYNISGTYGGVGGTGGLSVNAQTLTTTPTTSIFGWNFAAEGEASTYVLIDKTNNRSYRITLSIGPAYLSNMISIERLV